MSRVEFIARRAAQKRAAILAAARVRFAADGLEGAAMERIAAEAGVSTATLYRQFPSKLDLFAAVLRGGAAAFEAALHAPGADANLRKRIAALAHAYAALLDDDAAAGALRAVFAAAPTAPEVAAAFYDSVKMRVAGAVRAATDAAEKAGLVCAQGGDPSAHLMGMIEHPILWRRLLAGGAGEASPAAIADAALAAFWRAYGAAGPSTAPPAA
jgi:AcrR family transcriptional regulator